MLKIILIFIGTAAICYGRPPTEGSLHLVYSKRLNEVRTLQAEPRSGVAYVYSITASESTSAIESVTVRTSDILFPQESELRASSKEIVAAPKVLPFKNNMSSLKQTKEKKTPFLTIDPLDPIANESGIS